MSSTHCWGDEDFDWEGLDQAIGYICKNLRFWRVDVRQCKEKYGRARIYCGLGLTSLHQITHPGFVYCQWPQWAWKLQFTLPARLLVRFLNTFMVPLHVWAYRYYYREAREKWPHLVQEIYRDADYYELLGAKVKRCSSGGDIIWWPEWDEEPDCGKEW